MSNLAVEVIHLTKKFKVVEYNPTSIKTKFVSFVKSGFKRKKRPTITVLDDISFSIKQSTTFGIMGRNGAGKSTLLKLICGIITPTSGQIKRNGKIVPLLELGAGFHPELTAKENILINGLMLGLSKKEIESKYDEILDFAELAHVANEPVRTFSSGMYIRLAFSVAININPDIVILDEIMGVGDQSFQKKSSNKILEFQKRGKTLVIVSHDPKTVSEICDKAILIEKGKIIEQGNPSVVAKKYASIL
jgi:ABC-type polysaccharide/polyol phosphate transport system ATPase subunit